MTGVSGPFSGRISIPERTSAPRSAQQPFAHSFAAVLHACYETSSSRFGMTQHHRIAELNTQAIEEDGTHIRRGRQTGVLIQS